MNLVVNFGENEDISYISSLIASPYVKEGGRYYTVDNDAFCDSDAIKLFRGLKASSPYQIVNIFKLVVLVKSIFLARRVVITSPSPVNIILLVFCSFFRKDVHSYVHDVVPHYKGVRGILYSIQNKLKFNYSERVFVFSEESKLYLMDVYPKLTVTQISLPSPAEMLTDTANVENYKKQYDYVWWGRPEEYKGWRRLGEFADRILQDNRTLLVISNVEMESDFYQLLQDKSNVTFYNRFLALNELIEFLQSCRVNICPYDTATQSGIVAFCTCIGLPSLVSCVGGLTDQVVAGVNGFLLRDVVGEANEAIFHKLTNLKPSDIKEFYTSNFGGLSMVKQIEVVLADD
jgi:glycosyltransferase involved in cell wall biosynthesis